MKLIVGLGNPGKKYENTRHNMGFVVIDQLLQTLNFDPLTLPSPRGRGTEVRGNWKLEKKFKAEVAKGEVDGEKIILAKPQTFMNLSGFSVKALVTSYKLQVTSLWVINDDLDLPLGAVKISFGASSAGHLGVQSIIDYLGTKDFWRLRIGIAPSPLPSPARGEGGREPAEKFVLKPFKKAETKIVEEVIAQAVEALTLALKDPKRAMNYYN